MLRDDWLLRWRTEFLAGTAFGLLLILGWLLLSKGTSGIFIFDDYWNLRGLEAISRNPSLSEALLYIVGGFSGQLGRPLALATFALQHESWPHHAQDFIYVNILLHLLNGALLYWALIRLSRLLKLSGPYVHAWPLAAAMVWMLTPLQASAALYVIQRMALLSGGFMILGLLLYLVGRERMLQGRTVAGLTWMTAAVGIGTGLGGLAKENAALMPLGLLVLEWTLLASLPRTQAWRRWAAACLLLPTLVLVALLVRQMPGILEDYDKRNFDLAERLFTESRVLFLYLQKLVLPSLYSIRLLYDDLPVSRGLLAPPTTLLSLVAWAATVLAAVRWRRAAPWFSFAVFWYLAHHALESTFIPLELAFEHRNYVAAIGPCAGAVWGLLHLAHWPPAQRMRPALAFGAAGYMGLQLLALGNSAALWGDGRSLIRHWAHSQPDSVRAQMLLADHFLWYGEFGRAVATFERSAARWPRDPSWHLAILATGCLAPEAPVPPPADFHRALARFKGQALSSVNMLDRLLTEMEVGICPRYSPADVRPLVEAVTAHPAFRREGQNLALLRSRVAELEGDRQAARAHLDAAIRLRPQIPILTQAVVWSLEDGDAAAARAYVELARGLASANPWARWAMRSRIQELDDLVEAYAANILESQPTGSSSEPTGGNPGEP